MALAQIASASFHPSHSAALWSCTAGAWASMPGSSGHNSIHSASLHYCHMAGTWLVVAWSSEQEFEPRPRVINGFLCWRPGPQGSAWHGTPPHKSPSVTCQQRGKGSVRKQGSQAEMKCQWCMADTPCLQVAVSFLQFSQLPQVQMQESWGRNSIWEEKCKQTVSYDKGEMWQLQEGCTTIGGHCNETQTLKNCKDIRHTRADVQYTRGKSVADSCNCGGDRLQEERVLWIQSLPWGPSESGAEPVNC